MIKILIVDDSKTETMLLKSIIESDPEMMVVGCAKNGNEAIDMVEKLKPDLITMDICMPILNGLEATHKIMSQHPTPIVVISSKLDSEIDITFRALEAGALSVLAKPLDVAAAGFNQTKKNILNMLRAMSEIHVIKKRQFAKTTSKHKSDQVISKNYELIAIGCSVGGPQVLRKILTGLPADFPVPIVIVQHMTSGFIEGFSHWLDSHTKLTVKIAANHEMLRAGTVYFAPDHQHLEVHRLHDKLIAVLTNQKEVVDGFCPSITVLFKSVAKACKSNAIGSLLTGMGNDGATGLLALKQANSHTIIQDKKSSVVFGMAAVAMELGAVDKVIEIDDFAKYFIQAVARK